VTLDLDGEKAEEPTIVLPLKSLGEQLSAHLLALTAEKRPDAIARFARIGFEKKSKATSKQGLGDPPGNVALVDFLGGTIRWFA
jgi:hypothetical protein